MSVNLSKGQRINLSKEVEGLSKIMVGLGWDAAKQSGGILNHLFGSTSYSIDCDASAITMGNGNKYRACIYYGNLSEDNVYHHGDNLTGDGDGDDEQITVDLAHLSSEIERIVFVVNIYNCTERKQDFGLIKNAYIRLVDESTGKEICKYNLSDDYAGKTAMIFGEAYRHNGEWKFNAIGQGTNDASISQLINRYR